MSQLVFEKIKKICNTVETENMVTNLQNQQNVDAWKNNPLLNMWAKANPQKNTAGQDITAGIDELASGMLSVKRPQNIGRMLVRRFNSARDNTLKVRKPKAGKSVKTSRGKISISSHAERQEFLDLTATTEIEVSDEWDLNYLESAEWNVVQSQTQEITETLQTAESQFIIDHLKTVTTASSAGLVTLGGSTKMSPDLMIQAWGNVLGKNGDANTFVINPARAVELFQEDDFKNQLILGQFANYAEGRLGNFMGMRILMSTQVPAREMYAFDSNRFIYGIWRRDRLITPYSPRIHVNGIQASSKLGVIFADTEVCSPIRAA